MLFQGLLFLSSLVTFHQDTELGRVEVVGKIGNLSSVFSSTRCASKLGQLVHVLRTL
jgi:hypothetical protein